MKLIDKDTIVAEIKRLKCSLSPNFYEYDCDAAKVELLEKIEDFIDTIEAKEVDLTDRKTEWSPSKNQMESFKDMLKYNIGVFDYQKFMEVNSLYEDLTKISDYEMVM